MQMLQRPSAGDRAFDIVNYGILTVLLLLVLYPLYFIVIASVSNPLRVTAGDVILLPKGLNGEGYRRIFQDDKILRGYLNSIFYMVAATSINLALTIPAAYALSRKDLAGRGWIMLVITFTMFFSGGLIPRYLVVKNLGMTNTVWAMLLPTAVGVWNLIISKSFFEATVPQELLDASRVDGCSNAQFFFRVVLPISPAILAVQILFYGVGHWNSFFDALIFLRDRALYPLPLILREILLRARVEESAMGGEDTASVLARIAEAMKFGLIIVASLPMMILYPFVQKYFVKGVMIGAIKG
jgi:putative aldouronate transport system permease protein